MGNFFNGKHREFIHLVVIAGVVAKRAFVCQIVSFNHPFQHNFRAGRYLQIIGQALYHLGFTAPQQARKCIFG